MIVELILPWRGWKAFKRFPSMPEGQANLLIQRGIARYVDEQPSQSNDSGDTANIGTAVTSRGKKTGLRRK